MADLDKKLLEEAKKYEIDTSSFEDDESLKAEIDKVKETAAKEEEDSKDASFWKDEAKKAFKDRDQAKDERRKLQAQIKNLKEGLDGAPKSDELEALQKQVESLSAFKTEADKAIEEEELKNKSELEKAELRFNKQMETIREEMKTENEKLVEAIGAKENEIEKRDGEVQKLRKHRLRNEVLVAAQKHKAYNPSQIVKLIEGDFEYDDDLDDFYFYKKDSKGKLVDDMTVEQRIQEFLEDPDNENLVEAGVSGGSGHRESTTHTRTTETTTEKKDDEVDRTGDHYKKYDPKNEVLIKEAEEKNFESVWDLIDVKVIRDKRLDVMKSD